MTNSVVVLIVSLDQRQAGEMTVFFSPPPVDREKKKRSTQYWHTRTPRQKHVLLAGIKTMSCNGNTTYFGKTSSTKKCASSTKEIPYLRWSILVFSKPVTGTNRQ